MEYKIGCYGVDNRCKDCTDTDENKPSCHKDHYKRIGCIKPSKELDVRKDMIVMGTRCADCNENGNSWFFCEKYYKPSERVQKLIDKYKNKSLKKIKDNHNINIKEFIDLQDDEISFFIDKTIRHTGMMGKVIMSSHLRREIEKYKEENNVL